MSTLHRPTVERAVVGTVLSAVGVAAFIAGLGYGVFEEDGRVGPGFMPVMAGGLMTLFGLVDLALTRRAGEVCESVPEASLDLRGRTSQQRRRLLVAVFALLLATILLVQVLGFLLSFGLLIFVCSAVLEKHRLLPSLLVAGATVAGTYGVFVSFLHVPLPAGSLGLL